MNDYLLLKPDIDKILFSFPFHLSEFSLLYEIIDFFDTMAKTMGDSKPTIEKPIVRENKNHLIECVHNQSNRSDGISLVHYATVLWTLRDGKIVEGQHFFADPQAVDSCFTEVAKSTAPS